MGDETPEEELLDLLTCHRSDPWFFQSLLQSLEGLYDIQIHLHTHVFIYIGNTLFAYTHLYIYIEITNI